MNDEKKESAIKKVVALPVKGVTKPITSTLVPRAVRRNTKFINDVANDLSDKLLTDKNIPYCPSCLEHKLVYSVDGGHWLCPNENCDFELPNTIERNDINGIKNFIRMHGSEYNDEHSTIDFTQSINKRVFSARVFFVVACMATLFLIFTVIKLKIFVSLTAASIVFLFLLLSSIHGYRAWQLATNNLYSANGKEQFNWYVLNNNWLANPLHQRNVLAESESEINEEYKADED